MDEEPDLDSLIWGRIIEQFFLDLIEEGFMTGCAECNFPTPSVFERDGVVLCRSCRTDWEGVEV